jgi:diguanylate cyclase (GGDEF)-like protein
MKDLGTLRQDSAKGAKPGQMAWRLRKLEKENARLRRHVTRLRGFRMMAYRDPLTGMWNRRYFEERLKEEHSRCLRVGPGRSFSVLIVDINFFKDINDQRGHLVGDEVLKWLGDFLTAHLRAHDIACRTGGDEFMVLLPDVVANDVARVVQRLRKELEYANQSRALPVSLSLGAASWPDSSVSCESLLASADAAMYEDKRAQRLGVRAFDLRTAA